MANWINVFDITPGLFGQCPVADPSSPPVRHLQVEQPDLELRGHHQEPLPAPLWGNNQPSLSPRSAQLPPGIVCSQSKDSTGDTYPSLQYVIGFDSVDDESKPENAMFDIDVAVSVHLVNSLHQDLSSADSWRVDGQRESPLLLLHLLHVRQHHDAEPSETRARPEHLCVSSPLWWSRPSPASGLRFHDVWVHLSRTASQVNTQDTFSRSI